MISPVKGPHAGHYLRSISAGVDVVVRRRAYAPLPVGAPYSGWVARGVVGLIASWLSYLKLAAGSALRRL